MRAHCSGKLMAQAHSLELLESRRLFAAGAIDPTFHQTPPTFPATNVEYMVRQGDGKLLTLGSVFTDGKERLYLARYDTAGKFDPTFGQGGQVYKPFKSLAHSIPRAITSLADGKFVVLISTTVKTRREALVRFNADGSIDQTFGAEGISAIPLAAPGLYLTGLATLPSGKL